MRISLEQMLAARDRRAEIQRNMLDGAGDDVCLVCLTLNIAGDVKRSRMTRMLFEFGISEFEKLGLESTEHRTIDEDTGSEAFRLVKGDAGEIKRRLEEIEDDEGNPAARLFDFDVLVPDFPDENDDKAHGGAGPVKLSRLTGRKCLLCDRPAAECARSRRHGIEAVKSETERLLQEFCADRLARAAYNALISELETTPKPGLVDMNNNGAHRDMDADMFRRSAEALVPYFKDVSLMGMKGCSMKGLRPRGIEAEREMFGVTGGVNTHKGIIYSMGLLLAGMGMAIGEVNAYDSAEADAEAITAFDEAVKNAAMLAAEDAEEELRKSADHPVSNGGEVYKKYGIKGAPGEAASGFPNAVCSAERLACYKKSMGESEAGALTLCDSIARLDDTNLLHRGGREGLEFTKRSAERISSLPHADRIKALEAMDEEMIKRNLSPGGSADMLALAYLLDSWKEISRKL